MKKLNTKILLIVLVVLVLVFTLSRLFRAPSLEGNLRKELVSLDTAKVDEIKILSFNHQEGEIKLSRQGNQWKVYKGTQQSETDRGLVNSLLGSVQSLKPIRLASRKKEKYEEYNVGEKGIHVTISAAGKKQADLIVGKTGFTQGGSYTFVRLSDENNVFAIEGFLESSFNRSYNDWRNKTILRLKREDIAKITYRYPADSGFVVEKRDSVWYAANAMADQGKVNTLLSQLSYKTVNDFSDGFVATQQPTITIQIDAKAGSLATIQAWNTGGTQWVINSSLSKDVYYTAPASSIPELLTGRNKLFPDKK